MARRYEESAGTPYIGAGYAMFQLSKALLAREDSSDPAVRERADERIARWEQVIAHALHGTAQYGSRRPFANNPVWATPEVVTGGFATGHLLAGGDLTEYERELSTSIAQIREDSARLDLNTWHLTDEGLRAMQARLADGDYRIELPEEAALPTVAWLLGQQRVDEARELIEIIAPYFRRLRFFPPRAQGQAQSVAAVHVFACGEVKEQLATLPAQCRLAVQKRVVSTRLPLYDAAIAQFLATYVQDWPCRHFPEGWMTQSAALCFRFDAARDAADSARKPSKDRVGELYALLNQCVHDREGLSGRQVGRIRRIVDDFVRKHGHPHCESHRAFRSTQQREVAAPGFHLFARGLAARLSAYPAEAGIADFAALLEPITAQEAADFALPEGLDIPVEVRRRLERCRSGTIAELIEFGLITSGDTLARLLPTMTAEIRSAGFGDATLRGLYAATYRAFRRRRSVLLLHLQSQVALHELPWIAAMERYRASDDRAADVARQMLVDSAALSLSAFPQAIIPNKLLQEFRALAKTAELDLPLVDEIAADIFMGEFSNKFIAVARRTAGLISGSLYARYYAIDTGALAQLPDRPESKASNAPTASARQQPDALAVLCARRARAELGTWQSASNGAILEQQQILTTQNLALLFRDLGLRTVLQSRLGSLSRTCFDWICQRQQMRITDHHARLVMLKNSAYAWRQMLFYLSMLDEPGRGTALAAIDEQFAAQAKDFQERFMPAMLGLRLAAAGQVLPQHGATAEGARVFLGWTTEAHWLISSPRRVDYPRGSVAHQEHP